MPRPRDPGESTEPLPPSDVDLIAASRAGDAAAYDSLYRRHLAAAYGLARQLVRNRAEADDVVAETFAKILDLLHRGGGPDDAFRPYLLAAVRRAAYDRHRAERRQLVTDEMEAFDRGVSFADPAVADLERTLIARAFASLPERWQAVLWHTEIEGARPADVAPLLGLTANSVAALAYRAREGLRQAYLQMHLSGAGREATPAPAHRVPSPVPWVPSLVLRLPLPAPRPVVRAPLPAPRRPGPRRPRPPPGPRRRSPPLGSLRASPPRRPRHLPPPRAARAAGRPRGRHPPRPPWRLPRRLRSRPGSTRTAR